ncbi:SH2 domain-containing protein [Legionella cincinnatiensis]|uniref:SH2 domain-containing protein n=1 Tax=Legionella cincinnatiensis TaxID=28085 RepID=A0A378IIV1_9GAMM|nr:SH2 domain-containing protein [Legionella cincinnatiensis]KTC93200.1 hypothetical protein Lcin_0238 [Legionella cincinnatiensis]STX35099.1 Uncharacterised protein [Legionella cincinnatiensis]
MQSQEEIRESLRQQMAQNNELGNSVDSSFSDAELDAIAAKKLMSKEDDDDPSLGWEISKKKAKKIFKQEDKGQILIFKRQITPIADAENILLTFENMLGNKPEGYWLIRESRKLGMISVTYKKGGQIKHVRFAFVGENWKEVTGDELDNYSRPDSYQQLMKENIKEKCDELLKQIFTILKLEKTNILIPTAKQASTTPEYSGYCDIHQVYMKVGAGRAFLYGNPLEALNNVELILNSILAGLKDPKADENEPNNALDFLKEYSLPNITSEELIQHFRQPKPFKNGDHLQEVTQLKEQFAEWLEKCNLRDNLFCPVTQELFLEPYYLTETGQVYDADGIFHNDRLLNKCPLTQTPIVEYPTHCKGYRSKLELCLFKFMEAMQLVQNPEQQKQTEHASKEEREVFSERAIAGTTRNSNFSPAFFTSTSSLREDSNTESACAETDNNDQKQGTFAL